MAKLNQNSIRQKARDLIKNTPGGIRYSQIVNSILETDAETPVNTINGSIWNLDALFPNEITKPARGLFKHIDDGSAESPYEAEETPKNEKAREEDFYQSFSDWLKNDLDEVVISTPLGGAALGKKWGTPDVIGVYKPLASQLIKFTPEVISVEIKIDPTQSVVAFGQAIAYKLFSTKAYIVMPKTIQAEDQSRLESLCVLHGVGLVLFELDKENPNYTLKVTAQRSAPDMFYVNEFVDSLKRYNQEMFEKLFG